MFIQIPVKTIQGKKLLKKIEIPNLSDNQLSTDIEIFEKKVAATYTKIRNCYTHKKTDTVKELNAIAVQNEKILHALYEERKFRFSDLVVVFNKALDLIENAQVDDDGVKPERIYENTSINDDFNLESITLYKNKRK